MEETTFYITNLDVFGLLIIFISSEASIFLLNVLIFRVYLTGIIKVILKFIYQDS